MDFCHLFLQMFCDVPELCFLVAYVVTWITSTNRVNCIFEKMEASFCARRSQECDVQHNTMLLLTIFVLVQFSSCYCGDSCRQNNGLHKEILRTKVLMHAEVSRKRSLTIPRKATRWVFLKIIDRQNTPALGSTVRRPEKSPASSPTVNSLQFRVQE